MTFDFILTNRMFDLALKLAAVVCVVYPVAGVISDHCLDCIWQVESNRAHHLGCRFDVDSDACGPFQIHHTYYKDCTYNPSATVDEWHRCAQEYQCSKTCVINYLKRYGGYHCPNNCEGFARMHNGGPDGCKRHFTDVYWTKIQHAGCSTYS